MYSIVHPGLLSSSALPPPPPAFFFLTTCLFALPPGNTVSIPCCSRPLKPFFTPFPHCTSPLSTCILVIFCVVCFGSSSVSRHSHELPGRLVLLPHMADNLDLPTCSLSVCRNTATVGIWLCWGHVQKYS